MNILANPNEAAIALLKVVAAAREVIHDGRRYGEDAERLGRGSVMFRGGTSEALGDALVRYDAAMGQSK